ncbi:MAG: DUF971 domain-containing protein [Ignavibacteriaceae bacterium]
MTPKQIKVLEKTKLYIRWSDDTESTLELKYLRDECPCASCKGETVLLKTYRPPKPAAPTPEMYMIKDIQQVGGYGIQVTWKDGHNTGIYTWVYLKELSDDPGTKHDYDKLL